MIRSSTWIVCRPFSSAITSSPGSTSRPSSSMIAISGPAATPTVPGLRTAGGSVLGRPVEVLVADTMPASIVPKATRRIPEARLAAIADVVPEAASKLAAGLQAGVPLSDHRRILDDPSIEAIITAIKAQLDEIEAQMVGHVREHFVELDRLLQSASGIGPVASATLIATVLGTLLAFFMGMLSYVALVLFPSLLHDLRAGTGQQDSLELRGV